MTGKNEKDQSTGGTPLRVQSLPPPRWLDGVCGNGFRVDSRMNSIAAWERMQDYHHHGMRCIPCTCAPEVGSSPETPNWEGGRAAFRVLSVMLGDKIYERK